MREKTILEDALDANLQYYSAIRNQASITKIQLVLDAVSEEVCGALPPSALIEHMRIVYEETAVIYAGHPDHLNIPDTLLAFMEQLSADAEFVLDLGCGAGRDAVFMSLVDAELRKKFMGRMKDGKTTAERFGVPTRSFYVSGVDTALPMLHLARGLASACGLKPNEEVSLSRIEFIPITDMHRLMDYETMQEQFDGVWSSAALFMHTPKELIASALAGVARTLAKGGIFGVSYANVPQGTPYNNLRISRTGEIKYFSRPSKDLIIAHATDAGLHLISEFYSDLQVGAEVKKDFFVTQTFMKV